MGTQIEFQSVADVLHWRAKARSEKPAFTFIYGKDNEETVTYSELDRFAQSICALLRPHCEPGDRVLVLLPPGNAYAAAVFGCFYAGTVAVPLYPPHKNRNLLRLEQIVHDAQARVALTLTSLLTQFERTAQFSQVRFLAVDGERPDSELPSEPAPQDRNAPAILQYTSGSTRSPRGVMVNHNSLVFQCRLIGGFFNPKDRNIIVNWLPPYHDMGLITGLLHPVYDGVHTLLMRAVDFLQRPSTWLELISSRNATHSIAPNFAYDLCVDKITGKERQSLNLVDWRVAVVGSEPIRRETLDRFVEAFSPQGFSSEVFRPCYGLAEATLAVSGSYNRAKPNAKSLSAAALENGMAVPHTQVGTRLQSVVGCGPPLPNQTVAIVHPETGTSCNPGEVGEIWIGSEGNGQGYWNRPEESLLVFGARLADTGEGPFLRSGDLGFIEDGELFVCGRLKDLIIIRGLNHYPQDIESTIRQSHEALGTRAAAAFCIDVANSERLVVAIEVDRHTGCSWPSVVEAVRESISRTHLIRVFAVILVRTGAIPRTSSGKIQRHLCRRDFLENRFKALHCSREDLNNAAVTASDVSYRADQKASSNDGCEPPEYKNIR